jgi:hypothetical protein
MKLFGTFLLVLVMIAVALAQPQNFSVAGGSSVQDYGLEIVQAHARATRNAPSERARAFSIVVKNTGSRVITSVGFTFVIIDDANAPTTEEEQNPGRYGFVATDLRIHPDDVFTIERELTGNHSIPEPLVEQAVRVQEIGYADGGTWKRAAGDAFGWTQVKLLPAKSADQ